MHDYPEALELHQQALNLYKRLLGENHPDYAQSLDYLTSVYAAMGRQYGGYWQASLQQASEARARSITGRTIPDMP